MTRETIEVNGKKVSYVRIDNDAYRNPRYVVNWLDIGNFDNYEEALKIAKKAISAKKYRGKKFGGGIVITSYDLKRDLERLDNASKSFKTRFTYKEAKELREEFINSTLDLRDFISEYYRAKGYHKVKEVNASIAIFSYQKAKNEAHYNRYVSHLMENWGV